MATKPKQDASSSSAAVAVTPMGDAPTEEAPISSVNGLRHFLNTMGLYPPNFFLKFNS